MTEKDWDTLAAFEKAIAEKYGAEAIQNPKANWDETKEEEYLEQMREFYHKIQQNEVWQEKIDVMVLRYQKNYLIENL